MLTRMDDKDLIDRLRLIRTSHIGPVTCQLLLRRYKTPKAALQAILELSARGGRALKLCSKDVAEKELSQIRKSGAELICHGQEQYPASLLPFDDAHFILTAKGHIGLLHRAGCAIVARAMRLLMLPILPRNWPQRLASRVLLLPLGWRAG